MTTKIAILGGGMGSLAAAFRLTETPADRAKYDITVYQRDWLLGGKGASTRNQGAGNGLRIEEHGIHLLLGFYNTALHLLRSAYAELADPVIGTFDNAILPWDSVWMADEHPAGWRQPPWRFDFPSDPLVVPGQTGVVPGTADLLKKAATRFGEYLDNLMSLAGSTNSSGKQLATAASALIDQVLPSLGVIPRPVVTGIFDLAASLVDTVVQLAWTISSPKLATPDIRHAWISVFLLGTNLCGALRERVPLDGTAKLDALDYRAWLKQHSAVSGLPPHLGWEAPPIRALYDLAFSRGVGLAAGVSLGAIARMVLGYEGHFTYKMNGGMGEVVFAPLYHVLKNRGVKFEFFHEVTALSSAPNAGGLVVEQIQLQAPAGTGGYAPTSPGTGNDGASFRFWPAATPPLGTQPRALMTLTRGTHFDVVILGISVGGLTNALVGNLSAANPAFAAMVTNATHVATQSMQLWMTTTPAELGWTDPKRAMLISFDRPFNSWVDMSHLLGREAHPASVKSIHYLCDELKPVEGTTAADVKQNGINWIGTSGKFIWPSFTWNALDAPAGSSGTARMDAQYFRANNIGSDRYVTVGPGSVAYRLAPGATGFRNLAIAGDWVLTQLSAGCLEAATTGGFGAADAILAGTVLP